MTKQRFECRNFDDVDVGATLPPLSFEVTATDIVLGAVASRDWRPMHHDQKFAVERNGVRDIFLNTPTQAGWLEHYVTRWAGPAARLGRMKFSMKQSIFPGSTMVLAGEVNGKRIQNSAVGWIGLSVLVSTEDGIATSAAITLALPVQADTNLWTLEHSQWNPNFYQWGNQ